MSFEVNRRLVRRRPALETSAQGRLVLIQALQVHQGDTGGKDPGGFSVDSTEIFAEGLAIPVAKLVHRGTPRRDIIDLLIRNNRLPPFAGDIAAMIGAVQSSVRSLLTAGAW